MTTFDAIKVIGDVVINGVTKLANGLQRIYLALELLTPYAIDLSTLKISTTGQPLTATANGSDLGYTAGTYGTSNDYVQAGDVKTLTGSRLARFRVTLPPEYAAGQAITIRFAAGMLTTVAGTSCTIACQAYVVGRNTLVSGTNLVTTSAQSMNSLTFANKDFTLTPTNSQPGDALDVLVTIAYVDAATGTTVRPCIAAIDLVTSIRG